MMRGKMSPGQRARLATIGLTPEDVGKIFNRAGTGTSARRTPQLVDVSHIPDPKNDVELAEMLGDDGMLRKVAASPDVVYSVMARYGKSQQAPGTALHAEVEHETISTEVQRQLLAYLREHETPALRRLNMANLTDPQWSPQTAVQRRYAAGYNPEAPGAVLDNEFKNAGHFFRDVWMLQRRPDRLAPERRAHLLKLMNTFTEQVPADGGFLVPEALRSELLRVSLESGVTRSRARVIPMETLRIAFPKIDSTTNDGSLFGGMIAYWTQEAAALTQSQATFGQIMLEAFKLTGLSKVSNELLADSMISFTALIEQLWPEVIAFFQDDAYIGGSGVGMPLGWKGAANTASIGIAKETSQVAATIVWANIIKMFARMLPSSLNRAVWVASPDTFPELATMALNVGTAGSAVWLGNGAGAPPITILGRPVIFSEKMSVLGTRGDISFVDLGYYLVGDRQAMSLATSEHSDFDNDLTAFRIIDRSTGKPWLESPITPANGGNTLSPFVEIATRA